MLRELQKKLEKEELLLKEGGGVSGVERQKRLNRLTVRERLQLLFDKDCDPLELGLWAGWQMYSEWGELPAAGVITAIGKVKGRSCMVIANDATVKAGAFFPQSVKKVLRAQKIAYQLRLPTIYLVDSSGVFLPLQSEIFPDEDDFGRIFRNNALFSSAGIVQFAAIMGNCIAGGGYLPVLCDHLLMTEGSGLYLAGPALVKAAIGAEVTTEELGGAKMHASLSGTVDYLEKDDTSCLHRLRELVSLLPKEEKEKEYERLDSNSLYELNGTYDVHLLINQLVDQGSFSEYKEEYGKTIVTGFARIGGIAIGVVANQREQVKSARGEIQIGGVIYPESADKTARFIMECNQMKVPILFLQDVMGFMVGTKAEEEGIIRKGAKVVNALSNSVVPKITVIIGNSFGAGNYALCGKAYDPLFIFAWPSAKIAVMGASQAADTLFEIEKKKKERDGVHWNEEEAEKKWQEIYKRYVEETDVRFAAAHGYVDAIIAPDRTRDILITSFSLAKRCDTSHTFSPGAMQV